jgi:hypothetical protein
MDGLRFLRITRKTAAILMLSIFLVLSPCGQAALLMPMSTQGPTTLPTSTAPTPPPAATPLPTYLPPATATPGPTATPMPGRMERP